VGAHLLGGLARAPFVLIRGVANQRGERADQKDHLVSQLLKLAQFAQGHGVSQVQVAGCRIDSEVHAQRYVGAHRLGESLRQFLPHDLMGVRVAKLGATHQQRDLMLQGELGKGHATPFSCSV